MTLFHINKLVPAIQAIDSSHMHYSMMLASLCARSQTLRRWPTVLWIRIMMRTILYVARNIRKIRTRNSLFLIMEQLFFLISVDFNTLEIFRCQFLHFCVIDA